MMDQYRFFKNANHHFIMGTVLGKTFSAYPKIAEFRMGASHQPKLAIDPYLLSKSLYVRPIPSALS